MLKPTFIALPLILVASFFGGALCGEEFTITITDTTLHAIGADFFGLQYHANTYNHEKATEKLDDLHVRRIRLWARVADFHPRPEQWDWRDLDRKMAELQSAGYKPILCLYQSKSWFIGTADNPWWDYAEAIAAWEEAAFRLADRYRDQIDTVIIFDEPNLLHPEESYYMPFKLSAQLYVRAARQIKSVGPEILCGGPSAFGGWENGHWAGYVLQEPLGRASLDFISCNIFLSWDAADPDELIMDRTIWYEEAPQKIRSMLGENAPATLVLDAYNASALWQKDGALWTDPRNTNAFGGVYHAAAILHSASGGFDIALHWETLGGFGVLSWYPQFDELPPYEAWRFLIDTAGLAAGARMLGCATTQPPRTVQHHSGMKRQAYTVQPFALRRLDAGISVILVNKYVSPNMTAAVKVPPAMNRYALYRYDPARQEAGASPLGEGEAHEAVKVECPPMSVSVVRFTADHPVGLRENTPLAGSEEAALQIFPNPFNASTRIAYAVAQPSHVTLAVYSLLGQRVRLLADAPRIAGEYHADWDGRDQLGRGVAGGLYVIEMRAGGVKLARKVLVLK